MTKEAQRIAIAEKQPPPIGLRPRWLVTQDRMEEIRAAICRYAEANTLVPLEWMEELEELGNYMRRHSPGDDR